MNNKNCKKWYEKNYKTKGFKAQRLYPNEELLRFMGNNYFPEKHRNNIKILELGCGSGANLWMIAKENFDAYGIDISPEAVRLCKKMLQKWGVSASLRAGDFMSLPYKAGSFDCVVDVLATYCLPWKSFLKGLDEIRRVLKNGGKFFSFTPSVNSNAFKNFKPAKKIDCYTLNGIKRKNSPYVGNNFPFRFVAPADYGKILRKKGFRVSYLETVARTYRNLKEKFEYVVIVAEK
ncbi:MAG: class I SAM-dependent methyltransferase [Patescibacteria group bacterium]|nr:class I SAM-dependent methyltransferase [Patescibacteria group bacterium]MDD5295137.1 class I SAM-dependent methyltransferase [Patescibacteria group bacterium]